MDFFKNRSKIAFWSALVLAIIEIARQYALGDYPESGSSFADFIAVFSCAWLIWHFNFLVDDYQERKLGSVSHRNTAFRLGLSFLVGAVVVLLVESLVHRFFREAGTNLLFYFLRGLFHNMVILVIYYAMQAQRKRQQMEVENAALKEENMLAQLDLLRQQVQPHFLFNALNTLKSMVKGNDPNASDFILHLSGIYRYLLQSTMKQQSAISEELEILNSYAFLLKTRFSDNFNLDIQLPPQVLSRKMPPLTFQLLLENAVKHNVVSMDKPLHIKIYCPDEGHLAMCNNLQPKKAMEESNGAGLENINRRYQLLIGKGIEVTKTDAHFTVKMPII